MLSNTQRNKIIKIEYHPRLNKKHEIVLQKYFNKISKLQAGLKNGNEAN